MFIVESTPTDCITLRDPFTGHVEGFRTARGVGAYLDYAFAPPVIIKSNDNIGLHNLANSIKFFDLVDEKGCYNCGEPFTGNGKFCCPSCQREQYGDE